MYVNEYWLQFAKVDFKWHILMVVAYGVILIVGIVLNLMVIYYLIRIKTVKRPDTYFLINLAVADLFKLSFNITLNILSSLKGKWIFNQLGCDIYVMVGGLFGFVSISTLLFMSIERYLMIRYPLLVLKIGNKTVFVCILFTYIYSICWILPQKFIQNGFVLEGFLTSCSFNYISRDSKQKFLIMAMFIGGFLVPLILIVVFYSLLWRLSRSNSLEMPCQVRYQTKADIDDSISLKNFAKKDERNEKNEANCRNHQFVKRELRVARSIIFIVLMFTLAWLPYAIVTLYAQYGDLETLPRYITPFTTSLPALFAKFSSIYNPVIYTLTSKECKVYFKSLVMNKILKKKKKEKMFTHMSCTEINVRKI